MADETSVYPGTIDSWTTKEAKKDPADKAHINKLQAAILATQTELGTDPAGTATDVKTRLALALDDDGSIKSGSAFPGSPVASQIFFRTDLNILYIRNAANSAWLAVTQQLSSFLVRFTAAGTPATCDETGGYDTNNDFTSNVFTAPVAGRYQMNVIVQWTRGSSGSGTTFPTINLQVNSVTVHVAGTAAISTVGSGVYTGNTTICVILNLSASDVVRVVFSDDANNYNSIVNDMTKSYWSGALLNGS